MSEKENQEYGDINLEEPEEGTTFSAEDIKTLLETLNKKIYPAGEGGEAKGRKKTKAGSAHDKEGVAAPKRKVRGTPDTGGRSVLLLSPCVKDSILLLGYLYCGHHTSSRTPV
ncbi:MAG TPA: hypothetical protein VN445_01470 [Rectinemataceae bacterium]|nr:hypothetical protein [Rectinemataceae bacterium]